VTNLAFAAESALTSLTATGADCCDWPVSEGDRAISSVIANRREPAKKRKLAKVPFVELFAGRLQGVVSSGSDAKRVYVAFFEAGSGDFYCSTNNNRPCGGLRGSSCKHLGALLENAVAQYGGERVARYLKVTIDGEPDSYSIAAALSGTQRKEPANEVFSRFLSYLRYMQLEGSSEPMPEMAWFQ